MSALGLVSRHAREAEDTDSFVAAELQTEVGEAFIGAVRRGDAGRVQELVEAHPAVLERPDPDGRRPLMVALAEGHGGVVEVLLKNGADHSVTDLSGNSPLHVVAAKGNYEALRVFLKNVALPDINCTNKEGDSVLVGPASRGFSIVVECLLLHNADPNIANKEGRTPIMEAARKGHKEVIKVLIRFGADILLTSHEDYSGMPTALREAVVFGSFEVTTFVTQHCKRASEKIKQLFVCKTAEEVNELIGDGCSVNHRRGDGYTALMMHAESGNVGVVKGLLDAHSFTDSQDMHGQTALMKASLQGRLEVVKELVIREALIDLKCKEGKTALMYAVEGERLEVTIELTRSGADLTISDNNGDTAQKLAQEGGKIEIYNFLKQRSSDKRIEEDPFTATMTEYLQQIPRLKQLQNTCLAESPGQQQPVDVVRVEEEDPVKRQLHTYIKRVAELETRVEELTIGAEFSVMDEEDLSHYTDQPARLIEEFRKIKKAKRKAEQFSIEAKQTAQKASVELTQLKEQLLMEKHINELKVKHLLSDLEETVAAMAHSQEKKEAAYKVIMKALEDRRTPAELSVERMPYSPEQVLDVIVRGDIKTRFKVTLVAVGGLPGSGKSTLVDRLVPEIHTPVHSGHGIAALGMYEVVYCSQSRRVKLISEWGEFNRENIYMFMLIRALTDKRDALPMLQEWTGLPQRCLVDKQLQSHFKKVYTEMRDGLLKFAETGSDFRFHVMSEPNYVLLNVFDIGVSKALNESLPLIARLMQPFVLLNVLDLHRDGQVHLRDVPHLSKLHESQHIMIGRSRGHYYARIGSLCQPPGKCILIGTHKDKIDDGEVARVKKLTEAGVRAKAGDMGASELMKSEMLAVNLHSENDIKRIKKHIEGVIDSTEAFDQDLHLTWVFLRSTLMHYKYDASDFRMPRHRFDALARECGLKSNEDIENCLKFFTKIGSLLYKKEFFGDNVIYHPHIFFQRLNALYDSVDNGDHHCKTSLAVGILCKRAAESIWKEESDGAKVKEDETEGDREFFWNLMKEAAVAIPLKLLPCDAADNHYYDYKIKCPYDECGETDLLFVSTLRKEKYKRVKGMNKDSLYVTFNGQYMPGDIQAQFIRHLPIPGMKLKLTEFYNFTELELPTGGSFQIIVHGDVVELAVKGLESNSKLETEMKAIIKKACVQIMDIVLEYFPGFEYQIGLLCTKCVILNSDTAPNNNATSYLYILPTQYETELYCRDCGFKIFEEKSVQQGCGEMFQLSEGQRRWLTLTGKEAQFTTTGTKCYEARVVPRSELAEVVKLIPLECYSQICTTLGHMRPSPTHYEETIVGVLSDWQKQSPNNRREKLARILLQMGCYKAAIKHDAKVYSASEEEVPAGPREDTLSAVEIEIICNCAIPWRELAAELGLAEVRVREIEQFACTSDRERCRKVLLTISTEPDTRKRVIEALEKMGWTTAANSLRCGYTNRYSSHSLL